MNFSKLAAVAALLVVASRSAAADSAPPDCSRYRLYGLLPGMSVREVREKMEERGTVGGDRRSVEYSRPTSEILVEYDDDISRKTAALVLVRSHIPTSVDPAPVLRSLRERLGEPTTGKDSLENGLGHGPAAWVSEECGIVVQASSEGEHLWDPGKAGIYVEARALTRAAAVVVPARTTEEAVVDELLEEPVAAAAGAAPPELAGPPATGVPTDSTAGNEARDATPFESPAAPPPAPAAEVAEAEPRSMTTDGMTAAGVAVAGFGGVTYPERLDRYYVRPVFPAAARMARLSGIVHLRVIVREDGTVGETDVVASTRSDAGFEKAAETAVKRWRYRPATRDGRPVAASIMVRVDFSE